MAREPGWLISEPAIVTPSGTSPSSPQTTSVITGWLWINTVRYRFPPGPMGCLGFYIASGTTQMIPFPPSQPWIIGDDEEYVVDYKGAAGSGLSVVTANVGNYSHELLLTIEYYDAATVAAGNVQAPTAVNLVSSELLNATAPPNPTTESIYEVTIPA